MGDADAFRPASTSPDPTVESKPLPPLIAKPASTAATGDDADATPSTPASTTATTKPNTGPHWSRTTCRDCHEFKGMKPQPIPLARIETLCIKCHDGEHARVERHPVGRLFADERIVKPEDWPAPEGRLTCVTCHELDKRHRTLKERPNENPAFLRKYTDGEILAFCARCHIPTEDHAARTPAQTSAPGAGE